MENEWEKFRYIMECTNDIGGMRCVVGQKKRGSE